MESKTEKGRVILFTGKGGVGKTSVAAATALRAADMGHKTLVMSTDAAHSLADSFDIPMGGEPKSLGPNLWGQETDMGQTLREKWGTIKDWVTALLTWRGVHELVADEMAILPGMEELANLLYVFNYYEKHDYEVLIVDCAPTGETLRLLSFPEVLRWWMDKLFPIERRAVGLVRPIAKALTDIPVPEDEVFRSAEKLFTEIEQMHRLLTDPSISSVRLVVNAEKMVIKETQRTFTYLNLYGYATDLIVLNRLIPKEVEDRYFDSWKEIQQKHRQTIDESFAPVPILTVPLFSREVTGLDMLRLMGKAIYGDQDPSDVFFHGQAHRIQKVDGYYVLTLSLPFVTKGDINLSQVGDELIVEVGRYRRNIALPRVLLGLKVSEAKFEGEELKVKFDAAEKQAKQKVKRK